jgi:hypothetical protein
MSLEELGVGFWQPIQRMEQEPLGVEGGFRKMLLILYPLRNIHTMKLCKGLEKQLQVETL